ncbi:MAG: hypothetical protein ACYCW6_01505 [Candidatus Xenobia bacterium]
MNLPGIFHRNPFVPTTLIDNTAPYLQNTGLLVGARTVMRHRDDDENWHDRDQLVRREVTFKNGLTLQQQNRTVTILQGGRKVKTLDDSTLDLPTQSQPATVIHAGPALDEAISPDGAMQVRYRASGGGAPSVINLQGTMATGEHVDAVPSVNDIFEGYDGDNAALKDGVKGYWADDVGNHYYIHDMQGELGPRGEIPGTGITAPLVPHLLGDPQVAPMAPPRETFYERYEFTSDGGVKYAGGEHNFLGMGEEQFFNTPEGNALTDRVQSQKKAVAAAQPQPS